PPLLLRRGRSGAVQEGRSRRGRRARRPGPGHRPPSGSAGRHGGRAAPVVPSLLPAGSRDPMIRRTVAFALEQPLFLALMTVLFVGGGILAFRSLPIEAFPDVSDIQVAVITLFPGHAPEEVEKQVTIPLEVVLSGLPHQVRLFSHTQFGLSFLMLTFDDAVNDYFARQQVLERLQGVDLPPGTQPQMAPLSPAI